LIWRNKKAVKNRAGEFPRELLFSFINKAFSMRAGFGNTLLTMPRYFKNELAGR
jgi:hypothetical protein